MVDPRKVRKTQPLWPVRLIKAARALTIGLAYYLVVRSPGQTAPFVAMLGSFLTFDVYVALERRRHSLVGFWRALRLTWPRALATGESLVSGLLVGTALGLLKHLGLPYAAAAVATAGAAYALAEATPNNISAFIALLGAVNVFERVSALQGLAPGELLPAVWPVAAGAFGAGLAALAVGLLAGALMGFLTRLWLPRAYRSRTSLAYPEPAPDASGDGEGWGRGGPREE